MNKVLAALVALLLVACEPTRIEPVTAEVVGYHYPESWAAKCINGGPKTTVRTPDNRMDILCGYYGETGTTISGCWVTGKLDSNRNGFNTHCPFHKPDDETENTNEG